MSFHDFILVIHVLGWVFWLGTDVGVFLSAKISEDGSLSAETRLTVLKLGMILDMAPRVAVPVVFMTGVQLSSNLGVAFIPALAGWVFGLLWFAAVIAGIMTGGGQGALGQFAMRMQTVFYAAIALGMGGGGVAALAGVLEAPAWIALKWLSYAVIAVAAAILEHKFKPAVALYGKLGEEGASDRLNKDLHEALQPVYITVLVIYAATLVAGVSGLVKF